MRSPRCPRATARQLMIGVAIPGVLRAQLRGGPRRPGYNRGPGGLHPGA